MTGVFPLTLALSPNTKNEDGGPELGVRPMISVSIGLFLEGSRPSNGPGCWGKKKGIGLPGDA